jgi:hypothetical protein
MAADGLDGKAGIGKFNFEGVPFAKTETKSADLVFLNVYFRMNPGDTQVS